MSRAPLDELAARASLHPSYDELIRVAVEVCGAVTASVCFVNEAEGLLTIFGASGARRGGQVLALSGHALELWHRVRDVDQWLWLAEDACVPIRLHGAPIGYLALTFAVGAELSPSRLHVMRMLAQQASLGTGRAALGERDDVEPPDARA